MKKERSVGNAVYSLALMALLTGGMLGLLAGCPTAGGGGGGDECQVDADCDDDLFCNGDEACVDGKCESLGSPCEAGEECDEDADDCIAVGPQAFQDADATRGGSLYDKWWNVDGVTATEPAADHPIWATQDTNARSGSDTWRCKECHGWDYKGVDGAYASGSHMTGFPGLFGTTLAAQDVFDKVKDGHGLGAAGLSDGDIWDLAKFVLDGAQLDIASLIDADGAFQGDAANGETLYTGGIGTSIACSVCHGEDGRTIEFHEDEFIGELAVGNPWEFQHKVRYGNPGTDMPAATSVDATNTDVADVGAYAQTLAASDEPEEFSNADANRGGQLYDKWWNVEGVTATEPADDHPIWATQDTNTRSGADTWRCKECHGWDYKGVDGAYGSGSHMTGFAGLLGTTSSAQEVFDTIKDDHGLGTAGLSDADVWDLAKFALEGAQLDTDLLVDADNSFLGDAANGETLYNGGIGSGTACSVCHGENGQTIDFGDGEFIGELAEGNPWEFQHKVWYGHPGSAMPAAASADATNTDVADVGAYAQTLVTTATEGDATAGEAFYTTNACVGCHGADATGGVGPDIVGQDAATVLEVLTVVDEHGIGPNLPDTTQQDADDIAAYLGSL